jgi:hypothetical protein
MRKSTSRWGVLVLILLVAAMLVAGGIGKAREYRKIQRMNDIKAIGEMYKEYFGFNMPPREGPKQASDFKTSITINGHDPYAYAKAKLADGSFVFVYGVSLHDLMEQGGASQLVLGYEPQAATNEGFVLMGDGEVKYVTADEFKTMRQAKPGKNRKGD